MSANRKIWWVLAPLCDPPHDFGRPEQVAALARAFRNGWGAGQPALVGYFLGGRVQLLSGSHRYAAACEAGLQVLPVVLYSEARIRAAWGDLEAWREIMDAPLVPARTTEAAA